MKKPLISIVIPVYNEEENITLLAECIEQEMTALRDQCDYEFIIVDDGSTDDSWPTACLLSQRIPALNVVRLSRNFGHQMALTAGYDLARGDAVITMDADLQDPPSLFPALIEQWHQGADIVYARRIQRSESWLKRLTAQWYYWFLYTIADVRIPRNVGDFRLIDARVVRHLRASRERSRYLRGMVAWSGFKSAYVDFKRSDRYAGTTSYTWKKMLQLAFDGMTGFSMLPLRLSAFVGVFVIFTGIGMFSYITIDAVFFKTYYPLFKWLVTVIYIFMGVQFLLLWLIGEYIGRMHDQQKNRPLYIINEMCHQGTITKH